MAGDESKSLDLDLDGDLIESRVQALVERGLERYGEGDLEGAMSEWEHALVLDPEDPKAREYVDYVQKNFHVLDATFRAAREVSDSSVEHDVPFGLEEVGGGEMEDDAYESLEIGESEPGGGGVEPVPAAEPEEAAPAPEAAAPFGEPKSVDEGWAIDEGWSLDAPPAVSSSKKKEGEGEEDLGSALGEVTAGLEAIDKELEAEPPQEIVLEAEEPEGAEAEEAHDFEGETSQGVGDVQPFSSGLSDDAILALGTPSPDETRAAGEATERSAEVGGLELTDFEEMETAERRDDRFAELELGEAGKGGPSRTEMEQHLESLEEELGHRETVELSSRALTDEPTQELEREEATAEIKGLGEAPPAGGSHRSAPETIDFDQIARDLLAEADAGLGAAGPEEQGRGRAERLLELARRERQQGRLSAAVVALDLALEEASKRAGAQELALEHHDDLVEAYEAYLGESDVVPALAVPLHELEMHELDHRAAFLLSRIDGSLSVEDILDVCGMSRLEAYRHLCRLIAQGILKVR